MFGIAQHGLFMELIKFGLLPINRIDVSQNDSVRVNDLVFFVRVLIEEILDRNLAGRCTENEWFHNAFFQNRKLVVAVSEPLYSLASLRGQRNLRAAGFWVSQE